MEDKVQLVTEKEGTQEGSKEIKIVINDGSENGGVELDFVRTSKDRGRSGTDPP